MSLDAELNERLDALREQNLFRKLRRVDSPQSPRIQIGSETFLNFSSNDYLGLANHPALKQAAIRAIEEFGAGAGASRLVCGSLAPFHQLETALARFKGTEAALAFSTGYAAAQGAICALLGRDDVIILDKLVHACIVDAAKLSGVKIRVFAHNDLQDLEKKLKWAANASRSPALPHVLIVTEAIFSMDGDAAPLREIVALKEKYGSWLMVDEAHATGIFGKNGSGLVEQLGLEGRVEIQMATLGKALGASGGGICGSRALISFLINRARPFIFSTAPVPAAAAAATAAIKLVQSSEGERLRQNLWTRVAEFQSAMGANRDRQDACPTNTIGQRHALPDADREARSATREGACAPPEWMRPIIPLIVGGELKAIEAAAKLREQNIFVPAIRYPTVARGAARLRVTLTAAHSSDDIIRLVKALKNLDTR